MAAVKGGEAGKRLRQLEASTSFRLHLWPRSVAHYFLVGNTISKGCRDETGSETMGTDRLSKRPFDSSFGGTAKQYLPDGIFTEAADLDAPRLVNLSEKAVQI